MVAGRQEIFRVSIRRRTDGKRRKSRSVCVRVRRRCGVVAGLIPRVCETFVERAGSRGLALLIAGKTAVAPAGIIVALKAERVSGRNLCMCARRALDRGNNKQRRGPFRLHASFPSTAMCHGGSITFAVHRDRTLGRRQRTAYAKSGNNFGKTIVWIFISPEIAHWRFLHSRCGSRPLICGSFEAFTQSRIRKNGQSMRNRFLAAGLIASLLMSGSLTNADALPLLGHPPALHDAVSPGAEPVAVRRGAVVARGPRGGVVAAGRTTVVRHGVHPVHPIARPGVRPVHPIARPGVRPWVRPARYYWLPGGAIAAGAAIGFVAAASVGAYAGVAPGPNYCWYYTDASRTKGFWDVCP
ncbi:hypothetical protein SAMN05444321_6419 [Bradyrhizobium lablabi]|nr:hypothetical protein SAMN05444321_6419 [Bradyrhizobium lablabi]